MADTVLLLHVLVVAFNIFGLVFIFAGKFLTWSWVRNPWFRLIHLLLIAVVVLQSWLSMVCPLTSIEAALRSRAGEAHYSGAFIAHWLEQLLYYQAPPWVFTTAYTLFGLIVFASWYWVRPRRFGNRVS